MLRNPYPGFRPFSGEYAPYFCGRGREIAAVLELLHARRLAVVTGESGCGKSSLVHAGVIPALPSAAAIWSDAPATGWPVLTVRPGTDPLRNLAEALTGPALRRLRGESRHEAQDSESALQAIRLSLEDDESALHDLLCERLPRASSLLIFVDQFEELFRHLRDPGTYAAGGAEALYLPEHRVARAFVANLFHVLAHRANACLVMTVRAEFLGLVSSIIGLPEQLASALYVCPRLEEHDIEKCIHLPAEAVGLQVRKETVGPLLAHYSGDNEGLPRLQHFLHRRAWAALHPRNHESPGVLDLAPDSDGPCLSAESGAATAERPVGNYRAAIDWHLDAVYERGLTAEQQRVAEALFRAFCYWNDRGTLLRRTVHCSDLPALSGTGIATVQATLKRLKAEGFINTSGAADEADEAEVEIPPSASIEVQHECILRCWHRLATAEASLASVPKSGRFGWLRDLLRAALEVLGFGGGSSERRSPDWGRDEQDLRRRYTELYRDAVARREGRAGVWRGRSQTIARTCFGTRKEPRINYTWAALHSPTGESGATDVVLEFIEAGEARADTVRGLIAGIVLIILLFAGFIFFLNRQAFIANVQAVTIREAAASDRATWIAKVQEITNSRESDPDKLRKELDRQNRDRSQKLQEEFAKGEKTQKDLLEATTREQALAKNLSERKAEFDKKEGELKSLTTKLSGLSEAILETEKKLGATASQLADVATRRTQLRTRNLLGYLENEADIGIGALRKLRLQAEAEKDSERGDPADPVDPLAAAEGRLWEIQMRIATPDADPGAPEAILAEFEQLWEHATDARAKEPAKWDTLSLRIARHFAEELLRRARTSQQEFADETERPATRAKADYLDPLLPDSAACRKAVEIIDLALAQVSPPAASATAWPQRIDRGWLLLDKALAHTLLDPSFDPRSKARETLNKLWTSLDECWPLTGSETAGDGAVADFSSDCERLSAACTLVEGHFAYKSAWLAYREGRPWPELTTDLAAATTWYDRALAARQRLRTRLGPQGYLIAGSLVTPAMLQQEQSSVHWFRLRPLLAQVRWNTEPKVENRLVLDEKWIDEAIGAASSRLDKLWELRKAHPLDIRRTDVGALQVSAMLLETSRLLDDVRRYAERLPTGPVRNRLQQRDPGWCRHLRFMSIDVLAAKLEAEHLTVAPPVGKPGEVASDQPSLSTEAAACEANLRLVFQATDAATKVGEDLWDGPAIRKTTIEFLQKRQLPIVEAARRRMSELEGAWKRITDDGK